VYGVSSEMARTYEKRARAAAENETRRRITEAAVELHSTVGPARTTVAEIARRAGVSRVTVYTHFPDDSALLAACSSHWAERHPAPDVAAWAAIPAEDERLRTALAELYGWYEANATMLENSARDAPLVPALAELRARRTEPALAAMLELLAGDTSHDRRALVAVALELRTWQALARRGLSRTHAAELMTRAAAGLSDY
jgi:AcrR family transcriptional regulator